MDGIIVDRLGYIYMVSNEEYANLKYTNIDITEYNIPNSNELEYRKNLIKDYFNEDLSAFIKPIFLDEKLDGYIIMVPKGELRGKRTLIIIWGAVILAIIVAAAIVKYFAELLVVKPIEQINNAAKRLAKGNVDERVEVIGNNEIGELAQSFNSMAQSIGESDIIRKELDVYKRQL